MHRLYSKYSPCVKCSETGAETKLGVHLLVRTCQNCGFIWNERPMDDATPEELRQIAESTFKDCLGKRPG